jgi:hypothetical protein
MTEPDRKAAEAERHAFVSRVFAENPQAARAELRDEILGGKIVPGMTPYEAKLAGGTFVYRVQPDEAVWSPQADPLRVMWAQTRRPDSSGIRMTFRNCTQFDSATAVAFSVTFEQGRAKEIKQEGP